MSKKNIIKCPNCGREYLPGEIYLPKDFLGWPSDIVRDENGVIIFHVDGEMGLTEKYTCDNCNKTFSINAAVTFKTEVTDNIFNND